MPSQQVCDDTDSKSLAMHTGVGLGKLDRIYAAHRTGYSFTGWYTEDGVQVYDIGGLPQVDSYDGSYHVLHAGYKLDFCPAGQYPKGEVCATCPEHNHVIASSPDGTTAIEQCFIPGGEGKSWMFVDERGVGIKYFETDCYAGDTEN